MNFPRMRFTMQFPALNAKPVFAAIRAEAQTMNALATLSALTAMPAQSFGRSQERFPAFARSRPKLTGNTIAMSLASQRVVPATLTRLAAFAQANPRMTNDRPPPHHHRPSDGHLLCSATLFGRQEVSHNWNCPDEYEARSRARSDARFDRDRYDYRNPYECDEANEQYRREYSYQRDQVEEEARIERRRQEAREQERQEQEYWEQQYAEQARAQAEEEAYFSSLPKEPTQ